MHLEFHLGAIMNKRIILIGLILFTTQLIIGKPISGKTKEEFAINLLNLIKEIDEDPAPILQQHASYQEYSKFLSRSFKDPNHEMRKKFDKIDQDQFHKYQTARINHIHQVATKEQLTLTDASKPYLEERKKHNTRLIKEGKLHFMIHSREMTLKVVYYYYKKKFHLLTFDRFVPQYLKRYVEPTHFVSNFWDSLSFNFPSDRMFYYPEMKSYESAPNISNNTVIMNNSPEIDSILHAHHHVGNSPTYELIDLNQDSVVQHTILILHQQDTLYQSAIDFKLQKYQLGDSITWIPMHIAFDEIKNDSVFYRVSTRPLCSLQRGTLTFTFDVDINFGNYSQELNVHNGAQTYLLLKFFSSTRSNELNFEARHKDGSDDFSKKIFKKIFQVSGELSILMLDNDGQPFENLYKK